ncbi:MAG: nitroreductase family protein [Phaeodactylibacter sp.]|nr:nitroreductase family protein [Phaeodactylibacter sp.]MCB9273636.1 nitroreductase family protein [Lewinellaceae bacterium]
MNPALESNLAKEARTIYPVHPLIRGRWSARSFSGEPIDDKDVKTLLEAASWAFSSMNAQPWRYLYAHRSDTEAFQGLWSCLFPGNQPWAANAAVLMVSVINKQFDNGRPNHSALHDLGAANATLMLQATSMGIYGHLLGGFDKQKTIEMLGLDPEEVEPVVFIALGYLDGPERLQEPYRSRETTSRSRKAVEHFTERLL